MTGEPTDDFTGRVAFCIGTGRCGTTFLAEAAGREPDVAASHERERLGATFHMFCKWHRIPIDHEGFLRAKEDDIRRDLASRRISLECSALLSHSLEELSARFRAKFVLLVRHPAETVASFAVRGWFVRTPVRDDLSLPPSYYAGEEARHFLGRNLPNGPEFTRWTNLTQIGRLAWFWQARNGAILDQFSRIPPERTRVQRLEDLDFAGYRDLARWLGWETSLTESAFNDLARTRPNAGPNRPRRFPEWTAQEIAEYEAEVAAVAATLGYNVTPALSAAQ
jgi:hypothetical protein